MYRHLVDSCAHVCVQRCICTQTYTVTSWIQLGIKTYQLASGTACGLNRTPANCTQPYIALQHLPRLVYMYQLA